MASLLSKGVHAPTHIHTHARAEVSTLEDTFEGDIGSSGTDIIGRGLAPCSSMEAPASRAFVLDTLLARTMHARTGNVSRKTYRFRDGGGDESARGHAKSLRRRRAQLLEHFLQMCRLSSLRRLRLVQGAL